MIRKRVDAPEIILRLIEAIHFPWKTKKKRYHARAVVSIPLRCLVIDRLDSPFSASMMLTLFNLFSKARFFWHGFLANKISPICWNWNK